MFNRMTVQRSKHQSNTQYNEIQENGTQQNDIQHTDTKKNDTKIVAFGRVALSQIT